MDFKIKEQRYEFCKNKLIPLVKRILDETIKKPTQIRKKGHGNYVTEIDIKIERKLIQELRILCPNVGFITEEEKSDIHDTFNWVIDPIDGTMNFINNLQFATSIALQEGNNREVLIGLVYEPYAGNLFYACKGCGSYKVVNNKEYKLEVGNFPDSEGIGIFGLPYNRDKANKIFELAKKYYKISSDLKRIGPASLDICMVASGQAKFYFELDLNEWDIAAGILILQEAGGIYKNIDDLSLFYSSYANNEINKITPLKPLN